MKFATTLHALRRLPGSLRRLQLIYVDNQSTDDCAVRDDKGELTAQGRAVLDRSVLRNEEALISFAEQYATWSSAKRRDAECILNHMLVVLCELAPKHMTTVSAGAVAALVTAAKVSALAVLAVATDAKHLPLIWALQKEVPRYIEALEEEDEVTEPPAAPAQASPAAATMPLEDETTVTADEASGATAMGAPSPSASTEVGIESCCAQRCFYAHLADVALPAAFLEWLRRGSACELPICC